MVAGLPGGKMAVSKTTVSAEAAPGGSPLKQPRVASQEALEIR